MIPRKLKICSVCGLPSVLWRSSPPLCKSCDQRHRNKLKQTNDSKVAKPFKITPVSKNRIEALKKYRRLRDKYFEEHPVCEFPACTSKKITLHHKRGRIGAFLTDKRYFCSLCFKHHRWVEENPLEARKMNLINSRLNVTI